MTHVDLIEKLLQYENGTVLCGEFFLADFGLCVDTIRRSGGLRRLEMAGETESDILIRLGLAVIQGCDTPENEGQKARDE